MIGQTKWNVIVSSLGMVLTIFISLQRNVWLTSLQRGVYTFIALFILTFIVRWLLYTIVHFNANRTVGSRVNLSTPADHDVLNTPLPEEQQDEQRYKEQPQQLNPLKLPKLETTAEVEEAVKVIRHMSEQ